jgi:DNA-3-methyladenine glycosylase II
MRAYQRSLRKAEQHLSSVDAKLGAVIAKLGRCELNPEWERSPYESLMRAVAYQQLHARAASAILQRFVNRFGGSTFPTPTDVLSLPPEEFRGFGFSQTKALTLRGIAEATLQEIVPSRETAESMSDEALIAQLSTIRGIGRWTVEMLLIFTLGRLDVMPMDDFGIKSGLQKLQRLKNSPKKSDFARLTANWAPYRSIGAWYLWRVADAAKAAEKNAKKVVRSSKITRKK